MAGTNNFLQWNPAAANQESDSAYTADSMRSGGAGIGAIFSSQTANKAFFQWSTFVAAFAAMMASKNFNMQDGNLANLQTALGNVVTTNDVSGSLASPTGWIKLPWNMILQWGVTPTFDTGPVTVSFPHAFTSSCFTVLMTQNMDISTTARNWMAGSLTATGFSTRNNGSGAARWFAIGQ
jgi:hypothetical protein